MFSEEKSFSMASMQLVRCCADITCGLGSAWQAVAFFGHTMF